MGPSAAGEWVGVVGGAAAPLAGRVGISAAVGGTTGSCIRGGLGGRRISLRDEGIVIRFPLTHPLHTHTKHNTERCITWEIDHATDLMNASAISLSLMAD
jgi:hypothetical protein